MSGPRRSSGTRHGGSGSGLGKSARRQVSGRPRCAVTCSAAKQELGQVRRETFIPQVYDWGAEAQVDWYEAMAEIGGEMRKVYGFSMRSMASGGAFHVAYYHATQQAFLEAHELAFAYFGGVFRLLRYDNLKSAVKKILRGHQREETERMIAFRSHWGFQTDFCKPARGNEKGGVEGEVGYLRRNHLVPVPRVQDLAELNAQLLQGCQQDQQRKIAGKAMQVGEAMEVERQHLLPQATESFELAEISFPKVDGKSCVKVRTNWYLEALLAMETEERDRHAVQSRLHDARLPRMKALEEFDF